MCFFLIVSMVAIRIQVGVQCKLTTRLSRQMWKQCKGTHFDKRILFFIWQKHWSFKLCMDIGNEHFYWWWRSTWGVNQCKKKYFEGSLSNKTEMRGQWVKRGVKNPKIDTKLTFSEHPQQKHSLHPSNKTLSSHVQMEIGMECRS